MRCLGCGCGGVLCRGLSSMRTSWLVFFAFPSCFRLLATGKAQYAESLVNHDFILLKSAILRGGIRISVAFFALIGIIHR